MHLDRDQIELALAAGTDADPDLQRHLESCEECRGRLAQARQEEDWIRERLGTLDHVPPPVNARNLMLRAERPRGNWPRLAAGIALALAAAGAAYAAPGSPLPRLIRRVVEQVTPTQHPGAVLPLPADRMPPAGIAVAPGERLMLEFASPVPGDTAVISLFSGSEVTVRATGGKTTFVSETDRLIVRQSGAPARFEILVPQTAPWVSLTAGQRRLWLKAGARIDGSGFSAGHYVLPLSQKSLSPAP